MAAADLLKFVISLRRIIDGYTTLAEVYRYIIDDELIRKNLQALKNHSDHPPHVIAIGREWYQGQIRQTPWTLWVPLGDTHMGHPYEAELDAYLGSHDIPFEVRTGSEAICADRRHRFEAIHRWFYNTWTRLDTKVKASIVEGVVVFLSLFDENPAVHRAFCPTRQAYITPPKPGEPRPLPPLEDLLETGHVLGLNLPVAMNPALARGLGVMLKLDFQRAVLQRIPKIGADPQRPWRDILFVADEYHAFATVGETDPTGDERAFALSRQARLIPIVATQSISSPRSALASDEAWRTLLQCFRTKVFLATSDEFTARIAAELCGRADRLKARYTLAEGGQGGHISLLSGRATASKHSLSASKTYMIESDYLFQPRVFTELQHAQAIAMRYDGLNPLPPQYCYLKPYYLDVQTSYFEHVARGAFVSSLDRILPFLRPIEDLLRDPGITEVMVNAGGARVFVERSGLLEFVPGRVLEPRNLTVAIKNIARACGDEISDAQPILDARLEDGSRVAAMFPPCAVAGPALTIRTRRYSLEDLVGVGAVTPAMATQLAAAIAAQHNVLIAGGTGTGKTTLLNALAARIPDDDRIIVIEETAEIHLDKPNILRFEARRVQAPLGQEQPLRPVTIADLVRASLRHRPDRIIVGEVRGPEAFDLLQGLDTGHLGSLSTIHANSAEQALTRLAHCVLTANVGLPHRSVREAIAFAVHLVVHIVFVTRQTEVQRQLSRLRAVLHPDAVVWVSWPKQSAKVPTDVTENTIRQTAHAPRVCRHQGVCRERGLVRSQGRRTQRTPANAPV